MHLWLSADAFEGLVPDSCTLDEEPSNLSVLVFVGNVLLVGFFLLAFLFFHIAVISGVEAYWLVKASVLGWWLAMFFFFPPLLW